MKPQPIQSTIYSFFQNFFKENKEQSLNFGFSTNIFIAKLYDFFGANTKAYLVKFGGLCQLFSLLIAKHGIDSQIAMEIFRQGTLEKESKQLKGYDFTQIRKEFPALIISKLPPKSLLKKLIDELEHTARLALEKYDDFLSLLDKDICPFSVLTKKEQHSLLVRLDIYNITYADPSEVENTVKKMREGDFFQFLIIWSNSTIHTTLLHKKGRNYHYFNPDNVMMTSDSVSKISTHIAASINLASPDLMVSNLFVIDAKRLWRFEPAAEWKETTTQASDNLLPLLNITAFRLGFKILFLACKAKKSIIIECENKSTQYRSQIISFLSKLGITEYIIRNQYSLYSVTKYNLIIELPSFTNSEMKKLLAPYNDSEINSDCPATFEL